MIIIFFYVHQTRHLTGMPTKVLMIGFGVIVFEFVFKMHTFPIKSAIANNEPSLFMDNPQLVI